MATRKKNEKLEDKVCEKIEEKEKVTIEECEKETETICEEECDNKEDDSKESFDDIELVIPEKECKLIKFCKKNKTPLIIVSSVLTTATLIGTILYVANRKE